MTKPQVLNLGTIIRPGLPGRIFRKHEVLSDSELNHHVHIVGASGFGKTVLIKHILKYKIQTGAGLLFIDFKNDQETTNDLRGYVAKANRENDLLEFSLNGDGSSASYNLLANGDATELRDRIMVSLNWSEEFYKNQAMSFLLKALLGLVYLRDMKRLAFGLREILQATNEPDYLAKLFREIPDSEKETKRLFRDAKIFLEEKGNFNSLQGLRAQLESLVHSSFGKRIAGADSEIDLMDAYKNKKLIFITLDSRRYPEGSKALGRFMLQDLKSVSARIDSEIPKQLRIPFTIVIDEFADLASEDFIGFLDRARSSKMSVVVAHQEICDLLRISPEFAGRLMGNTSTLYAFLQKRPESAEMISKIAGTRLVTKTTEAYERQFFINMPTGKTSVREVEEFVIHPNQIKSQRVGECVVVKKYPSAHAHRVRIHAPDA